MAKLMQELQRHRNVLFTDAVHRADEGHAGEAGAVELGRHGL